MNIAFYAPMKSPDHPQPSGDRLIARNTIAALELAGNKVTLASTLRSWEGNGDTKTQERIKQNARIEADNLIQYWSRRKHETPQLWFSYHSYYKSPDWLGPRISKELNIPYVLMEASHAQNKARSAPWQHGLEQARHAIESADLLISINRTDMEGLDRIRSVKSNHCYIPPFIDTTLFTNRVVNRDTALLLDASNYEGANSDSENNTDTDTNTCNRLLTIAMMREGDKLQSYKILAQTMRKLQNLDWQLDIVGAGQCEAEVQALFKPLYSSQTDRPTEQNNRHQKIRFHGTLAPQGVAVLMNQADYLIWPGINEALGMVYLEAQACGLPVVVGKMQGTADLLQHQQSGWLVENPNAATMASAIEHACQQNAQRRMTMRRTASQYCQGRHSLLAAAEHIGNALRSIDYRAKMNA